MTIPYENDWYENIRAEDAGVPGESWDFKYNTPDLDTRADVDMWPDEEPAASMGGGFSGLYGGRPFLGLNAANRGVRSGGIRVVGGQPAVSRRSSSSGGGYARAYPVSTTTTATTENILPSEPAPTLNLSEFNAPEWDEEKIAELSRKAAGPYVGGLRRGLNRTLIAIRSSEKNPAARAQMYRQAMEGFGGERGLGGVLAQARRQGRAEYGQQYGYEYQAAVQNANQQTQESLANYNAAMMIFKSKMKQKSTTTQNVKYSTTPTSATSSSSSGTVSGGINRANLSGTAFQKYRMGMIGMIGNV